MVFVPRTIELCDASRSKVGAYSFNNHSSNRGHDIVKSDKFQYATADYLIKGAIYPSRQGSNHERGRSLCQKDCSGLESELSRHLARDGRPKQEDAIKT